MVQVWEEVYFIKGCIIVCGKLVMCGKVKKVDFVFYYKLNILIVLIEVKDNFYSVGDGIQQVFDYVEMLKIFFVFSLNGDGFVFYDRIGVSLLCELNFGFDVFLLFVNLWVCYCVWKGFNGEFEEIVFQDYYDDGSGKELCYYQVNVVNVVIEVIVKGQDWVLLVMVIGMGKIYIVFQIIWCLWKLWCWNFEGNKCVLFFVDCNVLIDQMMVNDFCFFGVVMVKFLINVKIIEW